MNLIKGDCLSELKKLPTNCIDLIVTDPPYYRVKSDDWDNQWNSEAEFLAWCEQVLVEFRRVLKPNGSLYWFAGPYMAAKLELLIGQHYKVLNHIVWVKKSGRHNGCNKERLRQYFPQTERIIFAEPMSADQAAQQAHHQVAKSLYQPLVDYFNNARKLVGFSIKECVDVCGSSTASHYFSRSQFHFPSEQHFQKLMAAFGMEANYTNTRGEYEAMRQRYGSLKQQYQDLRRPFSVTKEVPFTDVWHFDPVKHYPGKHPCEKPLALLEHIIATSSRPGQVVLDAFMGSGSTGDAATALEREFIGIERDPDIYQSAVNRLSVPTNL